MIDHRHWRVLVSPLREDFRPQGYAAFGIGPDDHSLPVLDRFKAPGLMPVQFLRADRLSFLGRGFFQFVEPVGHWLAIGRLWGRVHHECSLVLSVKNNRVTRGVVADADNVAIFESKQAGTLEEHLHVNRRFSRLLAGQIGGHRSGVANFVGNFGKRERSRIKRSEEQIAAKRARPAPAAAAVFIRNLMGSISFFF